MKNNLIQLFKTLAKHTLYGILILTISTNFLFANKSGAQGTGIKSIYDTQISISTENATISDVFSMLERNTYYKFALHKSDINQDLRFNFNERDIKVSDILIEISKKGRLNFRQVNEHIFVSASKEKYPAKPIEVTIDDIKVTGNVTDMTTGEPLVGVTVKIANSGLGTTTDIDGNYTITVPDESTVLVFSFVGYTSDEITVGKQSIINIQLVSDIKNLQEIVVIGYGEQLKRDFTGSIANLTSEDFNQGPITTLDQLIVGRAAGVQITQNSAEPGGGISVRIRGSSSVGNSNEPLYVIDGYPIDNSSISPESSIDGTQGNLPQNPLSNLDPNDIVSIEVLKDASATAIYGARGANGVIMITTRRGERGRSEIQYHGYIGISEISEKLDLLNDPVEFATTYLSIDRDDVRLSDAEMAALQNPDTTLVGTDWLDLALRRGRIESHQLSFTGGDEKTRIAVSGAYFNQQGIVENTNLERYSGRVNVDRDFTNALSVGATVTGSRIKADRLGFGSTNLDGNVMRLLLQARPTIPAFNPDGTYGGGGPSVNPLVNIFETLDETFTRRFRGSVLADYKMTEDLSVRINTGATFSDAQRGQYLNKVTRQGADVNGQASIGGTSTFNTLFESTLTYKKAFGDHSINAVAGYSTQMNNSRFTFTRVHDFPTDALLYHNLSAGKDLFQASSRQEEYRITSQFGRINYVYKDRYLLTATIRRDGSTRFGSNNRYGVFPSGAFAIRLSEEDFIKNLGFINDLKIRTSYGITGNDRIPNLQSQPLLGVGRPPGDFPDFSFIYSFGGPLTDPSIGSALIVAGNSELTWEQAKQFNVGLDVTALNNRLSLTLDYYIKTTDRLILPVEVSGTTGFEFVLRNAGTMENKGLEVTLHTENIVGRDFSWTTDLNIAYNKNVIKSLAELPFLDGPTVKPDGPAGDPRIWTRIREGSELSTFFGYVQTGIVQEGEVYEPQAVRNENGEIVINETSQPGDPKFADINGDGVIDAADRTNIGNGLPDYIFGIANSLTYKNFELNFNFQGVLGNDLFNLNLLRMEAFGRSPTLRERFISQSKAESFNAAYTQEDYPQVNQISPQQSDEIPERGYYGRDRPPYGSFVNSRFVEDGSFIRLKNIRLAYTLPLDKWGWKFPKRMTVYASGQNLLTITDYSGFDPEVSVNGSNLATGMDLNSYPVNKTYIGGVQFTF